MRGLNCSSWTPQAGRSGQFDKTGGQIRLPPSNRSTLPRLDQTAPPNLYSVDTTIATFATGSGFLSLILPVFALDLGSLNLVFMKRLILGLHFQGAGHVT